MSADDLSFVLMFDVKLCVVLLPHDQLIRELDKSSGVPNKMDSKSIQTQTILRSKGFDHFSNSTS